MLRWLLARLRGPVWVQTPPTPVSVRQSVHRFVLYLEPKSLLRPQLGEVLEIPVPCTLELTAFYHGAGALEVAEAGFLRLRDRWRYPLVGDAVLWPGDALGYTPPAPALERAMGLGETLAPYVRTRQGLLYFEQPFVLLGADTAALPVETGPRPRRLRRQAQPPRRGPPPNSPTNPWGR